MVLLPFRNVTRAPANDWLVSGAPLMLGEALGQFTDLTVVPDARLTAAMRRRKLPLDVQPDALQLQDLAEETGGWTAISGNVFASGPRIRITAEALDVPTSRVISRAEVEVEAAGDIRPAFDRLAVQLLSAVGVVGTPNIVALTTRSIDAYRSYAKGVQFAQEGAFKRSVAALTEAVRLDTGFAIAWSALAFASLQANTLVELANPFGNTNRSVEQAIRHADRLSPRQAATLRILQAGMQANYARAHPLADSLVATDRQDVSAWLWLGMIEMLDSRLDTTKSPAVRMGSFNRSIADAKRVLELDPTQLIAYGGPAAMYGMASGFMEGIVGGRKRQKTSLGEDLMTPQDIYFEPVVVADSIMLMPDSEFRQLSLDQRTAFRRRAADAGAAWVERWLLASPSDPEAHLWASRFAEAQADFDKSFKELERAMELGPESGFENLRARRMSLLELTGRYTGAGTLADSIVAAGGVRAPPFHVGLDRSRPYVIAIYLRSKQWAKVAALVPVIGASADEPKCQALAMWLTTRLLVVPTSELAAVGDSVRTHLDEARQEKPLAPCVEALSHLGH